MENGHIRAQRGELCLLTALERVDAFNAIARERRANVEVHIRADRRSAGRKVCRINLRHKSADDYESGILLRIGRVH